MKTLIQKHNLKSILFIGLMFIGFLNFTSALTEKKITNMITKLQQTKTIKGVVSNEDGPLPGADVLLKGSRIGTVTDKNGAFTFPKPLKINDVLEFKYLGYEAKEVIIKENTQFIEVTLDEAKIEMIGALNSGKPYKSKRKN
ncbi:carboxypeptidase-like regulatory domain-containing protein [Winogradskyella ursingii]|uniref:carboxypeptidase-like regulatory domain-containing protein n=1 Tax=Winogradskyella ursingii TaxID=2686079 RepID=UPI0015CC0EEE|nr:carboxypeptidase-like regulatory domain-containing protein [Winogradskyella ursingii]